MPTERPQLVSEVNANFCEWRDVAWSARRFAKVVNLGFYAGAAQLSHEAEWTSFQTHYTENLVTPGIELGTPTFRIK
jgi:hypothetical protein